MSDRYQALSILRQARDVLVRRLTEAVLESGEEILDDAEGLTFTSHLETLQEQLGSRLNNVNSMITNLQAAEDDRVADFAPEPSMQVTVEGPHGTLIQASTDVSSGYDPLLELAEEDLPDGPSTFDLFLRQAHDRELDGASRTLGELFNDEALGRRCSRVFIDQLRTAQDGVSKVHRLRQELQSGSNNGVLALLFECFGLQGMEAIYVLQSLRARLDQVLAKAMLETAPGSEN